MFGFLTVIRTKFTTGPGDCAAPSEAEKIVKADRPPEEAAANVATLKRLLSRKENAHAEVEKIPVASAGRPD